ncbi:EpsG family protein [Microbacter margulisiae]|uniref:EpsG family protein n=1 Tax=Microbacter margulisiae TaxID=1350067 RepID=A0A7W5DQH8_9PORP|nr:EpsG family protein [Microbacter margulisiae]MBB3187177.1 hypothetical protein [Microbacter margulisiae]
MTVYYITIFVLFLFALLDINYELSDRTWRWMKYAMFLMLVLQVGLRWETGTDWNTYLDHFNSITDWSSVSPLQNGMEIGYDVFIYLMKMISTSYSLFLLVHAIIFYLLIFKSFERYAPYFYISLLMFYTLSMGMLGSNRQLIALAICFCALRYVVEAKPWIFFLLVAVAASFHTSAIMFGVFYFMNRQIRVYYIVLILAIAFVIGESQVPLMLFSKAGSLLGGNAASHINQYLNDLNDNVRQNQLSITGLLKRIVFVAFFLYQREKLKDELPYYTLLLNGYILGLVIYFLFANTLLVMISRGSFYFNMMEPLLLSSQLLLFKGKENRTIVACVLLVFAVLFLYQSIASFPDLFDPYKGLFLNTTYFRTMY